MTGRSPLRTGRRHLRLRRTTAVVVWALSLALGVGTGRFLLPEWAAPSPVAGGAPRSERSPSAIPQAARPTYARTPPTERELVSVAAFDRAGLTVQVYPENGNTGSTVPASSCTDARTVGARTLGDITGHDPQVLGTWTEPSTTDTASEMVAMAESPAAAEAAGRRLVAADTTCQHRPVGQPVLGPTHRRQLAPGVWATWLGAYPGAQNRSGEAPDSVAPCGGLAVVRNGQRFAQLEVFMCTDDEQLRTLALAAATRLG